MGITRSRKSVPRATDALWSLGLRRLRSCYRRAAESHGTPEAADAWEEFLAAMRGFLFLAALQGSAEIARKVGPVEPKKFADVEGGQIPISPFAAATRYFLKKNPIAWWKRHALSDAAFRMAFWVTGIEKSETLRQMQAEINNGLVGKGAATVQQMKKSVPAAARKLTDQRLETVIRTNAMTALNVGQRYECRQLASHIALIRLDEIHDSRTRGNPDGEYPGEKHPHWQMDGFVAPPGDPVWDFIWPPNGYNCRASTTPLTWAAAEGYGLAKNGKLDFEAIRRHNGRRPWYISAGLYPDRGFTRRRTPI